MCASCEAYLGDLKDNKKDYIHWNKYPMRDPNDFKYKQGSGLKFFSLQNCYNTFLADL